MTSMLLSVSMRSDGGEVVGWLAAAAAPEVPSSSGDARGRGRGRPSLRLLTRLLDMLGHHVLIRGVPVGDLHELAALHLPDLNQPAPLVILGRHLQRRHEAAEREVVDLLEALLHVLAGDLATL